MITGETSAGWWIGTADNMPVIKREDKKIMKQLPTYLKIVIRLIKMECDNHGYCVNCPISDEAGKCRISDIPCYWEVGKQTESKDE